jgi:hypothetical protein
LLQAYLARVVQMQSCEPPVLQAAPERPLASPLARAQAAAGAPAVSSLLHDSVRLESEAERSLLVLLDGKRSRRELERTLAGSGAYGQASELESALERFAALGLLITPGLDRDAIR